MAFSYRRSITLNHTQCGATDSTNFPVLVSLTNTTIKSVANGGHMQSTTGYDVAFYADALLNTRLPAEREFYSATTGNLIAWVNVPTVSHLVDTVIYMAYGDSAIVTDPNLNATFGAVPTWNSSFVSVYHLPDGTSLSAADSKNVNNGTINGATAVAGQIDGGTNVTAASSQNIVLGNINLNAGLTASAWINATTFPTVAMIVSDGLSTGNNVRYGMGTIDGTALGLGAGQRLFGVINNTGVGYFEASTPTLSTGVWTHVAYTRSDGTATAAYVLYINGASVAINPVGVNTTPPAITANSSIGNLGDQTIWYFDGAIDEVKLSSSVRSGDWILTEYNNQFNPGNIGTPGFYTMGNEVRNFLTIMGVS